jgi:hypothetical protein
LVAIAGNLAFALRVVYDGINEAFRGTRLEATSHIGLGVLLPLNTVLLVRGRRRKT